MIDKDIPHSLYAKTIHFKNSFILYGLNKLQLPFCFIIGVCNGCVYVLNPALKRWIKCFILRYVKDAVRHIEMSDQWEQTIEKRGQRMNSEYRKVTVEYRGQMVDKLK